MLEISNLSRPTFCVDEFRCRRNIERMADKARANNLVFRPHFKTHQSLDISLWFKDYGVKHITVSSVEMAEYFSSTWDDITIAFPANIREIPLIDALSKKCRLSLVVESEYAINQLDKLLQKAVDIWIKVDVGAGRTGIQVEDYGKISHCVQSINQSKHLKFKGFLTHAGQTYKCRSAQEVMKVHDSAVVQLLQLKKYFLNQGVQCQISIGDTPGCSVSNNFSGIDEIRPGNFIFYDLTQVEIGACNITDISVCVACPVVAVHKDRNEVVLYGGAVHLSKEILSDDITEEHFGRLMSVNHLAWGKRINNARIARISQEHGILAVDHATLNTLNPGDLTFIYPVHSCLTANLLQKNTVIIPKADPYPS